mmetsp:Transcript_12360/g.18060  ORF Transcript_12360/g.18060 Transcript_12360/m.18060 type:complete len:116 (+) Transcript_12360:3210-3557(+)
MYLFGHNWSSIPFEVSLSVLEKISWCVQQHITCMHTDVSFCINIEPCLHFLCKDSILLQEIGSVHPIGSDQCILDVYGGPEQFGTCSEVFCKIGCHCLSPTYSYIRDTIHPTVDI